MAFLKRNRNKILACALAFALCFALVACETGDKAKKGETKAEFWSTYATEKVLQDLQFTGTKTAPVLDVFASRGEYESGQIIMTAETKVYEYDVKLSSLKNENGETFAVENILLYNQKYIDVTQNFENTDAPLGMYPDALLPFEAAKKFGENTVRAGENQGLYFTFRVPETQSPGTYTGSFTVTYDEKTQNIPVKLEIVDLTVPNEVHAKNIFLSQWNYQSGELNGSQEMLDAYTDKLIEYRLAPQYIVNDTMHTDEDIAYYTERAYEYMQNERLSNISIPYGTYYAPNGELSVDKAIFAKYLRAYVQKSFDTGYNMFEKSNVYFNIIDEPDSQGLLERTKQVYADYKETIGKVADEVEAQLSSGGAIRPSAFTDAVIDGIRNLPEVIPCYYSDEYAPYVDTLVPGVQDLLVQYDKYTAHQDELWWYTCIGPRAPQPTYHTEDTLVSAREMSWMQAEYDVVGNLYWAVNRYALGANNAELEDYFSIACRYPQVNGDGYLFYPGGQYELDEPIGSLRLEAIRDGLEEYELALLCEEKYDELSEELSVELDWKGAFNKITKTIYDETTVTSGSEEFYAARRNFYNLAQMTLCGADFAMIDYTENDYGDLTYDFYVKSGHALTVNGKEAPASGVLGGGNRYRVELSRNDAREAVFGISGLTFTDELGGAITQYRSSAFENSFSAGTATVQTNLIDNTDGSAGIGSGLRGFFLQLKVGAVAAGEEQNIRFAHEYISKLNAQTDSVAMYVYYGGEKPLEFTVAAKFSKNGSLITNLATVILQPGQMNKVVLPNLYNMQWNRYESIEYLLFYYEDNTAANENVYLFDTLVYGR